MKEIKIFLHVLLYISISLNCLSQDNKLLNLDTLKYYKSRVDKYKIVDTALYNNFAEKIESSINNINDNQSFFYSYYILGELNKYDGLYEQAIQDYFHALEYSDKIENKSEVAKIYDELIFIYRIKSEADQMFECLNKAVTLKKSIGDIKGVYKSKLLTSRYYRRTGDFMNAFRIDYEALDFFETHNDTSLIIYIYHDIAMICKAIGNYQKAFEIYDNVYQYLNEPHFEKEKSVVYNGIGIIQLKTGDYQDALNNFLISLEIEKKIGNKFEILTRYNNIGLVYSYLKNFEPALKYFRICIEEHKKSGRWRDVANILNSVGMCYEEMNVPDSSIHYYLESIELSEQYDYKELNLKSTLWISKIYHNIGKYDSAYIFLRKYHELFEMIDKSNLGWKITAEEFEYIRQKDQRLKEIEKRNTVLLNIIIVGFLIFIIFIFWFMVIKLRTRIRKSQKAKQELEKHEVELKDQISNQNKELVSKILQLCDHNSGVKYTIQKLVKLKSEMGINSKQKIQQVINDLEHSVNSNIWDEFEHRFMKVHPFLYKNLSKYYPQLTANERRLCALIHLNFSSKEIAHITKQSHKSIIVAKSRLRSKINIGESSKITDFLHKLTQL